MRTAIATETRTDDFDARVGSSYGFGSTRPLRLPLHACTGWFWADSIAPWFGSEGIVAQDKERWRTAKDASVAAAAADAPAG